MSALKLCHGVVGVRTVHSGGSGEWAYLLEQLWGGISCQDGSSHVWAHSVELLNLPLPHLQQPLPSSVHPLAPRPLTLQVEGKARLLPPPPGSTRGNKEMKV